MKHRIIILLFGLLSIVTTLKAEEWPSPVNWKPDERAVKSGFYIQPKEPAVRAKVEFTVTEPSGIARTRWPVRGGIPIYRGELQCPDRFKRTVPNIRVLDQAGKEIPAQGIATAFWPELTVRFLCIDFLTDLKPNQSKTFTLEYGTAVKPVAQPLAVTSHKDGEAVDTGAAVFRFSTGSDILQVTLKKPARTFKSITGRALIASDEKGTNPQEKPLIINTIKVVENGPVQTTVHLLGSYGKEKTFWQKYWDGRESASRDEPRYPVSIFVRMYKDTAHAYIEHTFGYNGSEYKDFVQSYGLVIPTGFAKGKFVYGPDTTSAAEVPLGVRLNQYAHNAWTLTSTNEKKGKRIGGWAAVQQDKTYVLAAIREAWQNWPVAFTSKADGTMICELLGEKPGRTLDLRYEEAGGSPLRKIDSHSWYFGEKLSLYYSARNTKQMRGRAGGLAKIHELFLDFSSRDAANLQQYGMAHQVPLIPWPGSKRFVETKVLGHIQAYTDPKWDFMKEYFSVMYDAMPVAHEANGLYGWVDWGDLPMLQRPQGGQLKPYMSGGVGWSNGERALAPYFYHYAATGLRRFLDMGRAMVHHTIGIDTGHKGGDSRHGGYHRHNQVHWRHNPGGTRQGGFRGWHNYYWLTGDPEVGRLALLEGIDAPANAMTLNLKQPKGTWTIGQSYFSGVSSFLAHQCWITSGNWRYARAHRPIMKMYKDSGEKELPVLSKWHFYKVVNGEPEGYLLGSNKGPISGYFLTYGGDDLMVEWASLTGDPIAVDAVLLQGRLHGKHYTNKRMATYHSPEYLYLAMAFLEPKNADLPKLLENRLWHNQPGLKNFKNKGLKAPKEYKSAADWTRFNTYIYKKNGFSIHGAQCLEMIHLIRAMELIGKNP